MTEDGTPGRARGPRRPRRTPVDRSAQLQARIKDLILERNLSAGDPLPTEFELVEELDVGRNSLREAIKALQAVGIVEVRHGRGTYVGQMSLGALANELAFHGRITLADGRRGLAELTEVREILEAGLAQRLITQHPDADLSEVAAVIETMEAEAAAGEVSAATDRLFHDVLYRPLGSTLVRQLLGAFWDAYQEVQDEIGPPDETPAQMAQLHRDIYEAILGRDQTAVVTAMTAHFAGVRRRLDRAAP